jgi:hypothetical protein
MFYIINTAGNRYLDVTGDATTNNRKYLFLYKYSNTNVTKYSN